MVYEMITKVPASVWGLLYRFRLREHEEYSMEEYMKLYSFIVVDDVVYSTPDASRRVEEFERYAGSYFFQRCLPDAIIRDGAVVKNRFGMMNLKMQGV